MSLQTWMHSAAAIAISKTLLYSLWQAGIASFILALSLVFLRSSAARYAAACAALLVVSIVVVVTFAYLQAPAESRTAAWSGLTPLLSLSGYPSTTKNIAASSIGSHLHNLLPWLTPFWLGGVL